jgi:hypothetical protein
MSPYYDDLRHVRELIIKEMSSKSAQVKIISSNLALRQVLLVLQQIQDLPVHCLLAVIYNMYCMGTGTTIR